MAQRTHLPLIPVRTSMPFYNSEEERQHGLQQLAYFLVDAAPVSSLMTHTTDNKKVDFIISTLA